MNLLVRSWFRTATMQRPNPVRYLAWVVVCLAGVVVLDSLLWQRPPTLARTAGCALPAFGYAATLLGLDWWLRRRYRDWLLAVDQAKAAVLALQPGVIYVSPDRLRGYRRLVTARRVTVLDVIPVPPEFDTADVVLAYPEQWAVFPWRLPIMRRTDEVLVDTGNAAEVRSPDAGRFNPGKVVTDPGALQRLAAQLAAAGQP